MILILFYLFFLVIGFLVAFFTLKSNNEKILDEKQVTYDSLRSSYDDLKTERDSLITQLGDLKVEHAKLSAAQTGMSDIIKTYKENMKTEFRVLAGEILELKGQKLTEINKDEIANILNPLKTELKEFKDKVEKVYHDESKERHALGEHIKNLVETSGKVGLQADNLANALKTNVKMQGNWGEMLLESILEHSGLNKNREYFVQEYIRDNAGNVIKDENGNGLQPDITIVYPDQRKVIIDSKVSLLAWEQYVNETDAVKQKSLLEGHVKSLKQHVDGLSKKNYAKYAKALDYVIMFVPIEPAFLEALKNDTGLWKYAYDKQILIVAPTNLLAVLKIVADLWKIEQQSKNAIEIADSAGDLYDKFVGFVENMESIGENLNKLRVIYDKAFGQLSTGKGNILGRIEEIKKKGANAKKALPDRLIDKDED